MTLAGRVVGVTADRRSGEQTDLLTARGARVLHGPMLQTLDLREDRGLRSATEALVDEPPDWFLATTGFGVRLWLDAAEEWGLRDRAVEALGAARLVARGPKSRSALRQAGLREEWTAPGESMPEVVDYVAGHDLSGARVAVQLFDPDDHPTTLALRARCGSLVELGVYRWALPDDTGPAVDLIERTLAGEVDAVTWTAQPAVRFMFDLAGGRAGELLTVLNDRVLPVCIGPVCAEPLVEAGVEASRLVWPDRYRLVPMVKLVETALGPSGAG